MVFPQTPPTHEDHDEMIRSSSSSAFSESSASSFSSSHTSHTNSAPADKQQQQARLKNPLLYSPAISSEIPAIPPRSPGHVTSRNSIRLLERERRLSSGLTIETKLYQHHLLQQIGCDDSSPLSSGASSPVYSHTGSNSPRLPPLSPPAPLSPNRRPPSRVELSRSASLSTQNSPEIINPITPLDLHSLNASTASPQQAQAPIASADSPPVPPPRTPGRLSTYKLHQIRLESLDTSQSHVLPSSIIDKLSRWIVCVMVVQQDADLEPELKIMQPSVQFSDEDFRIISCSALSDQKPTPTNSKIHPQLQAWSQFHSFRFLPAASSHIPDSRFSSAAPASPDPASPTNSSASKELYGFSLYTQCPDPTSSRGFIQESIVILSRLNYPQLFNACLQLVYDVTQQNSLTITNSPSDLKGTHDSTTLTSSLHSSSAQLLQPELEINPSSSSARAEDLEKLLSAKLPVLQTALKNISQWPNPKPNSTLELGFLGTVINISIPHHESVPLLGTVDLDTSSANFHSNGRNNHRIHSMSNVSLSKSHSYKKSYSYSSTDLSLAKQENDQFIPNDAPVITASEPSGTWDYIINYISDFTDLYLLYEYVLLGKPIVVYANSPHLCSTFISLLIDLIRPIPYGGRVREYVTAESLGYLTSMGSVKEFESGGITGITDPVLLEQVQSVCSSNVLVFALTPNARLVAAQKQAAKLARAIKPASLAALIAPEPKPMEDAVRSLGSTRGIPILPITSPYYYYRTFHNGVGILRRQNNVWAAFSHSILYELPDSTTIASSSKNTSMILSASPPINTKEPPIVTKNTASSPVFRDPAEKNGKLSKFFSKIGFNRGKNTPTLPQPKSQPNSLNQSANSIYRTVPTASAHTNMSLSAKGGRHNSTPVVTMLEPAQHIPKSTPSSSSDSASSMGSINSAQVLSGDLSEEAELAIAQSIKQISRTRMLVPDNKFVSQITQMSISALQAAIPKSIDYITELSTLLSSSSAGGATLKSLLKGENLPFSPLSMPKSLDFAIRFHFATLTSRFLSPLSCYLEPLIDGESNSNASISPLIESHGFMKKHTVEMVTSSMKLKDSDQSKGSSLSDTSYKRHSRSSFKDTHNGLLKQPPAMITSQSMYSLSLSAISRSSNNVHEVDSDKLSRTHPSLTSKVGSNLENDKHAKKTTRKMSTSKTMSNISEKVKNSEKSVSKPIEGSKSSTSKTSNNSKTRGSASRTKAKRFSMPPMLTLPFGNYNDEEPDEEEGFLKEFDTFTTSFVPEALGATKGSTNTAVAMQNSHTAPIATSSHQDNILLLNNAHITGTPVEISSSQFSDTMNPNTPSQQSTFSMSSSSFNDGLISPMTPATPLTPATPSNTTSPKQLITQRAISGSGGSSSSDATLTSSSLLRKLSGRKKSGTSTPNNGRNNSLLSSLRGVNTPSGPSSPATSIPEKILSRSSSLSDKRGKSVSFSGAKVTESKPSTSGRAASLGLHIPRSNFSRFEEDEKLVVSSTSSKNRRNYNGVTSFMSSSSASSKINQQQQSREKSAPVMIIPELVLSSYGSSNTPSAYAASPSTGTKEGTVIDSAQDFKMHDIYKEFMNNMNFANWLKMNHTDLYN